MTFLAGLGGTSYSGPLSLQLFAQQPYAETPYKYVEHVKASNCLKQHRQRVALPGSEPYLLYKYLSILICITHLFTSMFIPVHLEFPSAIGHPFWKMPFHRISAATGCSTHPICWPCPAQIHTQFPRTHKGRGWWFMAVIDEIKKSKNPPAIPELTRVARGGSWRW